MRQFKKLRSFLYILLPALLALAYLVDLGHGALDNESDEGRRALVTAEMMISGDYITPTLQGAVYLNKPPLYNWVIAGSYKFFGNYSTFALRFPVIVSVFIFGFIIYYFVKKYTNNFQIAYFSALVFMTNGRILIYDSLQGLIDITFGWITFLAFMLVYHYGKKEKYYTLFITTYLLTAAGYMMKGLPALVCQGFALLVYFIYTKNFKKLFSLQHFAGIVCFLAPLCLYYIVYFSDNSFDPLLLFQNLLHESIKRTGVEQGFGNTILHVITFPFEMMYHYSPWTLLVLALFHKGFRQKLRENDFIYYNALVFLPNIFVYWTSPQVYARYLFMLLPLLFNVFIYFYFIYSDPQKWQRKTFEYIITGATAILAVGLIALPFIPQIQFVKDLGIKSFSLCIAFGLIAYIMIKYPANRFLSFCFALVILRFGFNWFVVENRGAKFVQVKENGEKIADLSKNYPLYILSDTPYEGFDGFTFQICTRRNKLLTYHPLENYNALYITDAGHLKNKNYTSLMEFDNYLCPHLYLVKFKP